MQDATLARARALLEAGQRDEAVALALAAANQRRGDLQAQMDAGFLLRDAGAFEQALTCFEAALRLQPGNPQIANIRANTLASAGRIEESLAAFAALLDARPEYLEAHINRALTAHQAAHARSLQWVEASLAAFPTAARLWSIKGEVLRALGRLDEALEAAEQAVALEPGSALFRMRLGVVLRMQERHGEALAAYDAAAGLGARGAVIDTTRAAALLELDRVDEAEALYASAFAQGDREAGVALLRLRHEYRGDPDPAAHLEARARAAGDAESWLEWLGALAAHRDFARLAAHVGEAQRRFDGDPRLARLAGQGRTRTGDAAGAYRDLMALASHGEALPELDRDCAYAALAMGDGRAAERHVQALLRRDPYDQGALAFLATAWRLNADPREFWLCDYERLIVPIAVPGPAGEAPGEFARTLATTLESLHRTAHAPGEQSLRQGTQTSGRLFARRDPAIDAFKRALEAAIARVIAALPDDTQHPFLSRKQAAFRWAGSWSVRLAGDGGRHESHFHSAGWMSSAYYVSLPQTLGNQTGHEGWITFGAPPEELGLGMNPRRLVRPEEGMLVLFPSYLWHGTMPFPGEGTRLTAAFDLLPAG